MSLAFLVPPSELGAQPGAQRGGELFWSLRLTILFGTRTSPQNTIPAPPPPPPPGHTPGDAP